MLFGTMSRQLVALSGLRLETSKHRTSKIIRSTGVEHLVEYLCTKVSAEQSLETIWGLSRSTYPDSVRHLFRQLGRAQKQLGFVVN